jgi:soluble lytic murein transglycosylase-like protein
VANLHAGARYLRQQLDTFGRVELALAAYNAGPNRVRRAGGIPPIRETQQYVAAVIRRAGLGAP